MPIKNILFAKLKKISDCIDDNSITLPNYFGVFFLLHDELSNGLSVQHWCP